LKDAAVWPFYTLFLREESKPPYDGFIRISLRQSPGHYHVRRSILKALMSNAALFRGRVLDVGCGRKPYRDTVVNFPAVTDYTGLDISSAIIYTPEVKPDYVWDGKRMPFDNGQFDTVMATEVLEHCPCPEETLAEIHRVLKPEGTFFFTVPFLFPTHEIPHDEYRFTPFSLKRYLEAAGFREIRVEAMGGWRASMGQMIGLFIELSPSLGALETMARKLAKPFLLVLMQHLYKRDVRPNVFCEGAMCTGFTGVGLKE
jgi:SAM-dependent methyltransferase